MKSKKKEKETAAANVEENVKEDLEKFIQVFEKPTRIYRFLRMRHLVSPIFLQRNLTYMSHRNKRSDNISRKLFKIDSLLVKKNTVKEEDPSSLKYLKLDIQGIYDSQLSPDIHEANVEVFLTKYHHSRKGQGNHFKYTSIGKSKVTVNPNWKRSSLDGTQSDTENYKVCQASVISKDGFSFKPKDNEHCCYINFTVTCCLRSGYTNGISNGTSDDSEPPQAKKRQGARSVSTEEETVTYSAEIALYGHQYQNILCSGTYDLVLQDASVKCVRNDVKWRSAGSKRPLDCLEEFGTNPSIKFNLNWTDDSDGQQLCSIPPSDFVNNNQSLRYEAESPQKIQDESQCTPQKKTLVTYQFLYNDVTRQQTDTMDNMTCPWCLLNCGVLYSLLKHLRLCHARLNFIYVPTPKGAKIDVSINDSYDGSYAGNPQDLNSHIGFAFHRLGPVRRTSITHVIVYRPKRPPHSLLEFYEPEKENQVCRQIIQGHNRLYYRTMTCMPLKPQEINQDSEDESTPEWLCQKSVNLIDEFTDVNEGEKVIMKMWNLHCMKYVYISDCQLPLACQTFVEEHGREIISEQIERNFLIHLVNMFDFGLITPDIIQRTMWQLYTVKDDMEMNGQISSGVIKQET
ncbi:Polycomb protein suz12 [Mactra antiquata]